MCFNVVSVSDFLSRLICLMLNCCIVLHHLAKTEALRISSESLELRWSRNLMQPQPQTQPQSVEAHTSTRVEMYQLCCRYRAETYHTRIWWTLGVNCSFIYSLGQYFGFMFHLFPFPFLHHLSLVVMEEVESLFRVDSSELHTSCVLPILPLTDFVRCFNYWVSLILSG